MTHLEPEDILRRALREAAGAVEPAADGLSQIRARLSTPRPLLVAWLVAAWETVSQFVMLRLEPALAEIGPRLRTALRAADTRLEPVTERLRPAFGWLIAAVIWLRRMIKPQTSGHERPSRYGWVRPVIAMAVVVLVAVVGGFAMSGLPSQIARDGLNVFSGSTSGSGGGGHSPGVTGGGKHYTPSSGTSSTSGTAPSPTPAASRSPKPKATPTPTKTPTAGSTSTSQSPSPPPTSPVPPTSPPPTSPPPSAGPTPTPSPSDGSQSAS
jgi:hypothetical protein